MSEIVKVELITKIKYKGEEHNLQELFNYLVEQLEQKENIIKEVREYIKENILAYEYVDQIKHYHNATTEDIDNILQILDEVQNEENYK